MAMDFLKRLEKINKKITNEKENEKFETIENAVNVKERKEKEAEKIKGNKFSVKPHQNRKTTVKKETRKKTKEIVKEEEKEEEEEEEKESIEQDKEGEYFIKEEEEEEEEEKEKEKEKIQKRIRREKTKKVTTIENEIQSENKKETRYKEPDEEEAENLKNEIFEFYCRNVYFRENENENEYYPLYRLLSDKDLKTRARFKTRYDFHYVEKRENDVKWMKFWVKEGNKYKQIDYDEFKFLQKLYEKRLTLARFILALRMEPEKIQNEIKSILKEENIERNTIKIFVLFDIQFEYEGKLYYVKDLHNTCRSFLGKTQQLTKEESLAKKKGLKQIISSLVNSNQFIGESETIKKFLMYFLNTSQRNSYIFCFLRVMNDFFV